MHRLAAATRKEFIQFFRRKPLIVLVIWTIAVEIVLCAYSITYDVTHLGLAVQDLDGSEASRELVSRFAHTESFDVRYQARSIREVEALLATGRATIALVIPPNFSRRLGQGGQASVQLLLDGSNSNSALIALGYATRIVGGYSRSIDLERIRATVGDLGRVPTIRNHQRAWYNPTLRSVPFEVVSMLTLGVMMIAIMLPAAGLAWEKEAGTIEQLLVMPFRPWEIMVAKVLPTFVVSLGSLALALWVPWWFGVPIRGSLFLFFTLSGVFLFSGVGLGLLWGMVAENLQQALLLSFFTLLPIMVISGVVVPVEGMPWAIHVLSRLSPLTYYLEIGLGVFLKGVGLDVLWPQALAMAGLGAGLFALGVWRFGRTMG